MSDDHQMLFATNIASAVATANDSMVPYSDMIHVLVQTAVSLGIEIVTSEDFDDFETVEIITKRVILAMQQQLAKAFEL